MMNMRMFSWCSGVTLLLLAVLMTAMPGVAFAQKAGPTPKFFLLPTQSVRDSVTSIVPERIGELSREQVGKDTRVDLMPAYEELRKQLGGSTAVVAEAEALYTSGIGLLTAGNDKQAAEAFQRSVEMMEENLADLTNFDILADALANLALAHHNSGFDLDARKRMQAYAHLRPTAKLDVEKFPKELRVTFDEEVDKVKKAGNGVLEISATSDAVVIIDGIERGQAPLKVRDVGFGHHYLVVRSVKGQSWTEQIRVRGKNKTQAFKADFSGSAPSTGGGMPSYYGELLGVLKGGTFSSDEVGAYLKELCAQTGAAYVGFAVMFKANSKYVAAPFAYSAASKKLYRGADVEFNLELSNLRVGVSSLADSLVKLALDGPKDKIVDEVVLGSPPVEVAVRGTDTTETTDVSTGDVTTVTSGTTIAPPPDVKSNSGNTWKYVGIAAGSLAVVGLAAGAIYLIANSSGGSADGFSTEVQW